MALLGPFLACHLRLSLILKGHRGGSAIPLAPSSHRFLPSLQPRGVAAEPGCEKFTEKLWRKGTRDDSMPPDCILSRD